MRIIQSMLLKAFIIFFAIGVALFAGLWLPHMAQESATHFPEYAHLKITVLIWAFIPLLPFYLALLKAYALLRLIEKRLAFSHEAAKDLGIISYCGHSIALTLVTLWIFLMTQMPIHPGLAIAFFAIILTSFTIGFFARLLKELLSEALNYKEEVDLTI